VAAAEAWPIPTELVVVSDCRAASDGREPLAALFHEHYQGLCRLAFLILGDGPAAEDVVQEAFARTFAGWARVRNRDTSHIYLRRAVINLSRTRARRRQNENRVNGRFLGLSRSSPPVWEEASDDRLTVEEAVRRLPERQRATVVLRYFLDLPEAEIAEVLGTHVGTVKSQLAKARRNLQQMIPEPTDD
jgi:RNA polymerase sigma-70 factor (sigma-E family)